MSTVGRLLQDADYVQSQREKRPCRPTRGTSSTVRFCPSVSPRVEMKIVCEINFL